MQLALATNDPIDSANDQDRRGKNPAGSRRCAKREGLDRHPCAAGRSRRGNVGATRIPGIKHVIAIASGKGGVGKSTVAANLAVALQKTEARVGLCDCDIYGPSISLMFGTRDRPTATEENQIIPIEQYNLRLMSMGFLLDDTSPGDFARTDGDALHPAIFATGGMGRARLSGARSAARHRRHSAHDRANGRARRARSS